MWMARSVETGLTDEDKSMGTGGAITSSRKKTAKQPPDDGLLEWRLVEAKHEG